MTPPDQLDETNAETLSQEIHGEVLGPRDDRYDEVRSIWNAMIDREPAVIARCTGAADVITCVDFAREHELPLAIKGGGHNAAGNAVCDGGLMVDLSPMDSVRVDPAAKTVRVGPGARMADLDHETHAFGLVTPGGVDSKTGVAGLTLGGGFGWLCRKFGLSIDNLRTVDIVTADGQLRHASETENPDLFWGVRGGGGNFGVVTSFEFDCHELTEVLAGSIIYPLADGVQALRHWRDFLADAPDELSVWTAFSTATENSPIPREYQGEKVLAVVPVYAGDVTEGETVVEPLRTFGSSIADTVEPRPFVAWQQFFDENYPRGDRYYWKSHNFRSPPDDVFDVMVEYASSMPSPQTRVSVTHLGGAVNRVGLAETAYPHRDAQFLVNITTRWQDPARDEECIAWTREYFDALAEYATGGTYVNLISEREGEESMAYRENYDRLVELKNEYDPENLFRMNQNIEPTT
jgi:FAD/FMN-containing dehydrogenase